MIKFLPVEIEHNILVYLKDGYKVNSKINHKAGRYLINSAMTSTLKICSIIRTKAFESEMDFIFIFSNVN